MKAQNETFQPFKEIRVMRYILCALFQLTVLPAFAESFEAPQFFYSIYQSNQATAISTAPIQGLSVGHQSKSQLDQIAGRTGQQFVNWVRSNGSSLGKTVDEVEEFFKYQPRGTRMQVSTSPQANENSKSIIQHKFNVRVLNLSGQAVATYSGWIHSKLIVDVAAQSVQFQVDETVARSIQLSVQNIWNRQESKNSISLRYTF